MAAKPTSTPKRSVALNPAAQSAVKQAATLMNENRFEEAEKIFRKLITSGIENYIVYGNLAAICGIQGRHKELIKLLKKTIQLKPGSPEAHNNLGNALREQGELCAAIEAYNKSIEIRPNCAVTHNNLGAALQEYGDLGSAIDSYNMALRLNPNFPDAKCNLGCALQEQGNLHAAIESFKAAIQLRSDYPKAHNLLGSALQVWGDLEAAIASHQTAIELSPNYPEAYNNIGVAHQKKGDLEAAISCFSAALKLNPGFSDAHYNLACSMQEKGDLDAATSLYKTVIRLNPNQPEAHNNLGNVFQEKGDLNAAITCYNSALELKSGYPEAHNNLGTAFLERGEITAALSSFSTAVRLNPNYAQAHHHLSMIWLLIGEYKKGWERYEYRFQAKNGDEILGANPKCTQWNGKKLKKADRLLLVCEQGLGDTIQFMRYAITLRDHGVHVSICAPTKLHGLIQGSGIDPSPFSPEQAHSPEISHWIPLLSLPRHLNVSPSNPVIARPYIKASEQLVLKWERILSGESRPIIGINWQGNPASERANSKGRSLPLKSFEPIVNRTGATLLSLQKGFGSEQLASCCFRERFVGCQDQVDETWDFLETAAIIANCDLVITSDTSVAHLAGGMGMKTWLLLKKMPEWRWGLEGDTTFWYPSMRLFRQKERDNWVEVLQRVAEALNEEFPDSLGN